MTQQQSIMDILQDGPLHIKEVASITWFKEASIRRVLWQWVIVGTFARVSEGVYTLSSWNTKAIFIHWDSLQEIKRLNQKFDLVFLDIPYKTVAVTGGNRWIKYSTISPNEFNILLKDIKNVIHNDSYIVHCYSNAPSGWKQMTDYNDRLLANWFKTIQKNRWQKLFGNGNVATNMRGNVMPAESLDIYSLSGKQTWYSMEWVLPKTKVASQKNPQIIQYILESFVKTWQWILDPFAWSGIVSRVALELSINSVSIEINDMRFNKEVINF